MSLMFMDDIVVRPLVHAREPDPLSHESAEKCADVADNERFRRRCYNTRQDTVSSETIMSPRALGAGISIGVNNFLSTLRIELTFLYFLWALALYYVFALVSLFLRNFTYLQTRQPHTTQLLLEWVEFVQVVISSFIMTNIGIWATAMYDDASRRKPWTYFIVFLAAIAIVLYQYKYASKSFFRVRPTPKTE